MTKATATQNYRQLSADQAAIIDTLLTPALTAYRGLDAQSPEAQKVSATLMRVANNSFRDRQWTGAALLTEAVLYHAPVDSLQHHDAIKMVTALAPHLNGIENGLATLTWALLSRAATGSPEHEFARKAHPLMVVHGKAITTAMIPPLQLIDSAWQARIGIRNSSPTSM